jgi:hypothetical protein
MNVSFERKFFFCRSIFDQGSPSFNDDDDDDVDHSHISPINLIAFTWMMQRPDVVGVPGGLHIQFGVSS